MHCATGGKCSYMKNSVVQSSHISRKIEVLYSTLLLSWVCVVRYTLCFPRGYQTSLSCLLTLFSHSCTAACCNLHWRSVIEKESGESVYIRQTNLGRERLHFSPTKESRCLSLCVSQSPCLTPPPSSHHSMPPRMLSCTHKGMYMLTTRPGH